MYKPTFGLADIPATWWVRLNDALVNELDKLNRQYKYNGKKRGYSKYWEVGELNRRTLEKMTEEEVAGYKRRHYFFEKLWGRHRWKDYHFAKDDPRRHVDTGPWITKEEIAVLREGINIDDENVNKAITGFRLGKFSDNVREMRIKQLPIIADKWWAWMLGFYFGAGNIHNPTREGENTRVGGLESIYIRIRVQDPVIPRFLEVSRHLGMQAVHYQMSGKKFRSKKRLRKIGAGTSEMIVFGWPEFVVLKKFGLPTAILDEKIDRPSYQLAAPNYRPKIPEWILEDDECMKFFIEGYLFTGKCPSVLNTNPQVGNHERLQTHLEVRINGVGYPEEDIRTFITQIHLWFSRHGIIPSYRQSNSTGKDRFNYTLMLVNMEAYKFLLNTFEMKPDMKTRLYVRVEADEDPVIFEAIRKLKIPENVILGSILEQPMTSEEVAFDLRMYPEKALESLDKLVVEGLAVKKLEHYYYEPSRFIQQSIVNYKEIAEEKRKRAEEYGLQLLYQCQQCTHVYVTSHSECGLCGGIVKPVSRHGVLSRLLRTRMGDLYIMRKLEAEI